MRSIIPLFSKNDTEVELLQKKLILILIQFTLKHLQIQKTFAINFSILAAAVTSIYRQCILRGKSLFLTQ